MGTKHRLLGKERRRVCRLLPLYDMWEESTSFSEEDGLTVERSRVQTYTLHTSSHRMDYYSAMLLAGDWSI